MLLSWLEYLGLIDSSEYIDFNVSTQISYDEGRPDIVIELFTEDELDLIFIESKLGAQEGHQQLRRYARELSRKKQARNRIDARIKIHDIRKMPEMCETLSRLGPVHARGNELLIASGSCRVRIHNRI